MSSNNNNRPHNNSRSDNRPSGPRKNNYRKNGSKRPHKGVPPRRSKKPVKLAWWQKFLKAIGLYKAPKQAAPKTPQDTNKGKAPQKKRPAKKKSPKQAPPQKVDSTRLYVGNLSYDVNETDLIDLFKGFGSVKNAQVIYNKRTQRSKGFAFVEMISVDDAKRAAEILHEQPFMGRNLIVNGARTEEEERSETSKTA